MEWTIRRLCAGDEDEFIPFLGRWISERSVAEHFEWLYRGNPHGDAITWIVILESSGQIIGCTSIFPRMMKVGGQQFLGSYGGDTFVDPDFRRRGIAQSLHEQSVIDMAKSDIQCHYGFPVPANFRAFIRAGALALGEFHLFTLPLNAKWISRALPIGPFRSLVDTLLNPVANLYLYRRTLRKSLPKINIQIVDTFDSRVGDLFDTVVQRLGVCCIRDAEYLNWRFGRNPFTEPTLMQWNDDTSILGYAVVDLRTERCQIMDLLIQDDEEIAMGCLASLIQYLIENRKDSVFLNLNPRGPRTSLFKRSGFIQRGKQKQLMALRTRDLQHVQAFNDPDNWFLMPGDDDST